MRTRMYSMSRHTLVLMTSEPFALFEPILYVMMEKLARTVAPRSSL